MAQDGDSVCQTTLLVELFPEALQAPLPLELRWEMHQDWDRDLRS